MSSREPHRLPDQNRRERTSDEHARHPYPLARTDRPLPGRPDDRARHDDRERRAAVDPRGSGLLGDVARLGRQCVPPDFRRLPAPGRPSRRPVRSPADVPGRSDALHARLDHVRAGDDAGGPGRGTRRAGARRRRGLRGRALADHEPVHGAGGAREGDGRVRVRDGGRRQPRRAARRDPDGHARLALDLPRQRPDRHCGGRALAPGRPWRPGPRRRLRGSTWPGRSRSRRR